MYRHSIRKLIRKGEWVISIDLTDAYFHVPIHPQSQKYLRFQTKKVFFSVSSSSFWCRDSSPRVHSHCQRGQTHSSSQEPQNPSISGRLASSVTNKRSMSQRFGKVSSIGPRTRLAYQFSKIGIDTHTKTGFSGLLFRPSEGSSVPNPEETRSAKCSDCFHQKVISLDSKKAHVAHRDFSFLGKNSATRKVTHETFPVVPKVALEDSPVIGHKDSSNRKFPEAPKVVGGYQKSYGRCSYPSSGTQHTSVYRCLTKRLGSSLKRDSVKWSLVKQGSPAPHQCIGAKSCSSRTKGPSGALTRSNSADLFRQQHSSILSEQRGRHSFHRNVCSYLENSCIHRDAMVLGSGGSLDQGTSTAPSLEDITETSILTHAFISCRMIEILRK